MVVSKSGQYTYSTGGGGSTTSNTESTDYSDASDATSTREEQADFLAMGDVINDIRSQVTPSEEDDTNVSVDTGGLDTSITTIRDGGTVTVGDTDPEADMDPVSIGVTELPSHGPDPTPEEGIQPRQSVEPTEQVGGETGAGPGPEITGEESRGGATTRDMFGDFGGPAALVDQVTAWLSDPVNVAIVGVGLLLAARFLGVV